jgi:CDP-4-dehydro-6-deoxyglucose reductase, E1
VKYPLIRNNFNRDDMDAVIELLQEDDPILTNGNKVKEFEKAWSSWLGVKYSVFVNSGSSANLLSLSALKLKYPEGGEVIVPPLTWVSDIASVIQTGFKPIFADIDLRTLGMSTTEILKKLNNNTKAVFLSHIQGFNALTDELLTELKKRNILLIEDVCESHGATFGDKKVGSFGWTSNFSFYYAHHMSTIEGGMICTDDKETYRDLRMLRSHGMLRESDDLDYNRKYIAKYPDLNSKFIFKFPAYNVRNTEIGGTLGLSQLTRLDSNNIIRTRNFLHFLEKIDRSKFLTDFEIEGSSNYAFNLIQKEADLEFSSRLMAQFDKNEIEFRRGSAGGGNQLRQPYLRDIFEGENAFLQFPKADHVHFHGFYLGNFPDLTLDDVDIICRVINNT